MGGTINWGIFKRHFWGELLRHQQHKAFLARIVEEGPIAAIHERGALAGVRSDHAAV
jgi:hypothetical protein